MSFVSAKMRAFADSTVAQFAAGGDAREFDAELEAHVAMHTEAGIAAGLEPNRRPGDRRC